MLVQYVNKIYMYLTTSKLRLPIEDPSTVYLKVYLNPDCDVKTETLLYT